MAPQGSADFVHGVRYGDSGKVHRSSSAAEILAVQAVAVPVEAQRHAHDQVPGAQKSTLVSIQDFGIVVIFRGFLIFDARKKACVFAHFWRFESRIPQLSSQNRQSSLL